MLEVALVPKVASLVCVEERRTVLLREAWQKKNSFLPVMFTMDPARGASAPFVLPP